MKYQIHMFVKGDVIGVGFRAWTKIQAKIIGVNGWVRNNFEKTEFFGPGGGVELVAQANESALERFVAILEKGPPVARVEEVDVHWHDIKEDFSTFEIRK